MNDKQVDTQIGAIIKALYDAKAMDWTIAQKGRLLAAIKLQLMERPAEESQDNDH